MKTLPNSTQRLAQFGLRLALPVASMLLLGGCVTKKYQAASAVGAVPLHMDFDLGVNR